MPKGTVKKVQTDTDVKEAVKLVVAHMRKKISAYNAIGLEHVTEWLNEMDELLEKPEFVLIDYLQMRRGLNDVIERTVEESVRFKLRDSWFSLGKALDKKVKQK